MADPPGWRAAEGRMQGGGVAAPSPTADNRFLTVSRVGPLPRPGPPTILCVRMLPRLPPTGGAWRPFKSSMAPMEALTMRRRGARPDQGEARLAEHQPYHLLTPHSAEAHPAIGERDGNKDRGVESRAWDRGGGAVSRPGK